jgi:hypothetical protein
VIGCWWAWYEGSASRRPPSSRPALYLSLSHFAILADASGKILPLRLGCAGLAAGHRPRMRLHGKLATFFRQSGGWRALRLVNGRCRAYHRRQQRYGDWYSCHCFDSSARPVLSVLSRTIKRARGISPSDRRQKQARIRTNNDWNELFGSIAGPEEPRAASRVGLDGDDVPARISAVVDNVPPRTRVACATARMHAAGAPPRVAGVTARMRAAGVPPRMRVAVSVGWSPRIPIWVWQAPK